MKILTDEQINNIYRSIAEGETELDYVKALLEAQAHFTRKETLKVVGEWLEKKFVATPYTGGEWHIRLDEVEALKQGKPPWEEA